MSPNNNDIRSEKPRQIGSLLFLFCSIVFIIQLNAATPESFSIDSIQSGHPRILASDNDFEAIRDATGDPLQAQYMAFLRQTAEAMLPLSPIKHELAGKRLLSESRKFLKRVSTWALLYKIDGNGIYRERAIQEMEAVAAFPDWNPQHYLDVGEMALGMSIGLDWFWTDLSRKQQNRFLDSLEEKGINPSLDESHPNNWWLDYNNNWNPVCHAGLVSAALLLADRNPELSNWVITRAIKAVPHAMDETNPDGVYPEGPVYWTYGTHFTAVLIDLLESACGDSFGLADHNSFRESIEFRSHAVSPTGSFYNFYDNGKLVRFEPVTAWYASRYGSQIGFSEMRRGLKEFLENNPWTPEDDRLRTLPMLALWYPNSNDFAENTQSDIASNWKGDGPNPVAFIRERWNDPNAFFLGFKGGKGSISHAHMDAGSFIFEDQGIRWAIDLDPQKYLSLESEGLGIWDRRQHADRWRIFRIGPYAHNLLLMDQRLQNAEAAAAITSFEETANTVRGIVDLSAIYKGQAQSYERTFVTHDYQVLQITDHVRGARERTERQGRMSGTLRWRMLTRAQVDIADNEAILFQDGKRLYFKILEPVEFTLKSAPIDPPPYYWDESNPGVKAIDLWCKTDDSGNRDITILMSSDRKALERVAESL
jgi:hypothetical protein